MAELATAPRQDDVAFQARLYSDPNATRRGLHTGRRDWIERQLDARVGAATRALEVGVGCGVFTRSLATRAASVTAIDINPKFLDALDGEPGITTRLADATAPFATRDFDFALCSEVLEHVPPERSGAMLTALHEALAPGGVFVLTTPQRFSTVELFARLLRFGPLLALARRLYGHAEELGHINLLTRRALRRQIVAAGFAIEETALFGFYLPVVAEFGGSPGWAALRAIERVVRALPLVRGLLWTQAYVLLKR